MNYATHSLFKLTIPFPWFLATYNCQTKGYPRYPSPPEKNKINYFTEIYIPLEPKLVSINYFVLHNLLPIRGGSECKLCNEIEYELKHILLECTAPARVRRHVQEWLITFNINNVS